MDVFRMLALVGQTTAVRRKFEGLWARREARELWRVFVGGPSRHAHASLHGVLRRGWSRTGVIEGCDALPWDAVLCKARASRRE